jgi:hypothetical protein
MNRTVNVPAVASSLFFERLSAAWLRRVDNQVRDVAMYTAATTAERIQTTDAASRLTPAEQNGEDAQLYIPSENVVDQRKRRWMIYKVEDGIVARYLCVRKPAGRFTE